MGGETFGPKSYEAAASDRWNTTQLPQSASLSIADHTAPGDLATIASHMSAVGW